jgi:predicted nucleic acid-binding Zn ribbon protein
MIPMNQPSDEEERTFRDDYRRKRVRILPPRPMRDVMSQLLAKKGYAHVQTASACQEAWLEAVGQKVAADTRAGTVRRGVLEVLVRNSSVVQELSFQKSKIVKTLAQLVPEQKIRDVRFRVGTID